MAIPFSLSFGAVTSDPEHARFVGAITCASSMCHGGAGPLRCQYTIWTHDDAHARAYATLVSDYGANIAKAAHVDSPTTNRRCVECHAPLALLGSDLAPTASPIEGVTCESCHNSAAAWLRSHTRPDYTYADRVHAGMRDMRDTFVRANTCVKCHQAIAPDLVQAGHPELTFELDGQDASEPRHWMEKDTWFGAKAWLVGQAVALRDIAQQAGTVTESDALSSLTLQRDALTWLLQQVPAVAKTGSQAPADSSLAPWSNQLAQTISNQDWSNAESQETLATLAGTSGNFRDGNVAQAEQAARAQRLVLALDRLLKATHPVPQVNPLRTQPPEPSLPGEAELGRLFDLAQDPKTFDSKKFADSLQKFADIVSPKT